MAVILTLQYPNIPLSSAFALMTFPDALVSGNHEMRDFVTVTDKMLVGEWGPHLDISKCSSGQPWRLE
jgi:hypothetical protein